MQVLVAAVAIMLAALRLPWTVLVCAVAGGAALLIVRSLGRVRRALQRARYTAEVAQFQWRDDISPLEFERRCAEALRLAGWQAHTTKGSGDQGVDVLAQRGALKIALQCKRYGRTVGNKAVQEVLSGKAFYDAHHGVVVSNAGFSLAARQLAEKTGILLLHFAELRHINKLLALGDRVRPLRDSRVRRLELQAQTHRHWLALWILMSAVAGMVALDHDLRFDQHPRTAALPPH